MHEDRLEDGIRRHGIDAELVRFHASCPTVAEAAAGAGIDATVRHICMIGADDHLIVTIFPGAYTRKHDP